MRTKARVLVFGMLENSPMAHNDKARNYAR